MMLPILLFLLGINYAWSCKYAKFSPTHTMCKYTQPGCSLIRQGVTSGEISVILDVHNKLRNQVATGNQQGQPKAANMKQLTWDAELAEIAQKLANQCVMKHDDGADRRSFGFEHVGQNLGMLGSSAPIQNADLKQHIENWFYKEVGKVDASDVKSFPDGDKYMQIGHYTQVVWAETTKVGCGLANYKDGKWYKTLLACNYGPSGNFKRAKIYEVGPACSKCANGCSKQYNGLCV